MPILVATAIIGAVCFLQFLTEHTGYLEFFKRLQWMSYDVRVRLASQYPQPNATNIAGVFIDDIVITDINDGTLGASLLEEIGDRSLLKRHTWPWPRFIFGRLVRELNAQGAKAVGFDIFFDQLDPNEDDLKYDIPGVGKIGSDEFFAQQLKAAGNVVLGTEGENLFPADYYRTNAWQNGNVKSESDYGVLRRVRPYFDHTNLVWHPMIQYQAKALGFNLSRSRIEGGKIFFSQQNGNEYEVPLNPDGSLNMEEITGDKTEQPEAPYTVKVERIWHMGIILGSQIVGLDLDQARIEPSQIVLPGKNGEQRTIPLDRQGYMYIDWNLRWDDIKAQNQDSVKKLLVQDAARHNGVTDDWEPAFKDKVVVIGSVGTGNNIADLGATPLESKAMLVTKHLNVANSVILGRFIQRHTYGQELFLILVMGIASATLTWRIRALSATIGVITIAAAYFTAATYLYVAYRYWLPFVFPIVGALMFTHVGMVTYRVVFEQREQRRVKSVFNKLVSPNVVNELLRADQLNLGGARRKITVFFADVRGFTEMTDVNQAKAEEFVKQNNLTGEAAEAHHDQQARETLETVNRYLATIADMVKKHNGTLDKYIGDCVMAFWGAPTPNEQHALYCVRAAIDAQRAMYALNQERFAENKRREQENETRKAAGQPLLSMLPLLALGTGINTGMVTVGLMGSDAHILNYTVFGRDVNLASRLEGVSGRGRIIIGEATYEEIKRDDPVLAATCVALEAVNVKGIRNAVSIYEVPWKQTPVEAPQPASGASPAETKTPAAL